MLRTRISSRRRRPRVRLMLLILLAIPDAVSAQRGNRAEIPRGLRTRPVPGYGEGAALPMEPDTPELSDLRLQRIYESALSILERGDAVNGLPLLQSILDHPRDTLYYPDPQDRDQAVSLKGLVLDTLNGLPESQLEQYNVLYDQAAREILGHASRRSAQQTLEDVVRRYYFTETGRQAALRLAKMYFDRGSFLAAALTFQRLLEEDRVPVQDRPLVLLQTAVALRLTGLDEKCRETLSRLEEATGDDALKVGGRTLSLTDRGDDALAWLDRIIAPGIIAARQDPQTDWLMFRGDSRRNAASSGSPPLREKGWEFRTIPLSETEDPRKLEFVERELQTLREKFAGSNYLQIPAMHPLIVGDRVVIRTLGNLKAIDLNSGVMHWETYVSNQSSFLSLLDSAFDSLGDRDEQISGLQEYVMQQTWRDLRAGTLSSDGTYVYAVEDLGVVDPTPSRHSSPSGVNKLVAYELSSGKATWMLSSSNRQERFLGPPLVQGGILYCLTERDEEIYLIALKNHELPDGYTEVERLWEQPLPLPVRSELDAQMPLWRLSGLTPSYANGMLICPIAHGTVVAYDLARGILAWQYRYPGEQIPSRQTLAGLNRIREQYGITRKDENRWIDSAPTIARGRILLTPCDSPELHCLNLSTGIPAWKIPRGDDLYIACVRNDQIVLVGRDQIHARHLESGAELWSVPIPMPSGRGFVSGSDYHLPLSTAAVAVIDLQQGELRAVIPSQHNRVPGNLVAANGFVVSQTEDRVFRYLTQTEMQQQLTAADETVDSRILRGELALLEGRTEDAVSEFAKTYETHQTPRLRELLVKTLLDALRADFDDYDQYLPQLRDLTRGTAEYPAFQEVLAEGLSESGRTAEAFSQFLNLIDQPLTRLDHRTTRQRSDVWARGHLLGLYRRTAAEDRRKLDRIVQAKVEKLLEEGTLKTLTRAESILQDFPGSLELQRARLAQLDEYTESLARELLLIRLSESQDESLRREAVGRHFRLLMKLERIGQAALVRDVLLEQFPDVVCVDEMTGTELAEWGLENRRLREYLARRSHEWPQHDVVVTPTRQPPSRTELYPVPVSGDPGLFAGWTFHFTSQKPPRLVAVDEFGKRRAGIVLEASRHEPSNLSLNRSIRLQGHLAVLVLADEFFVLDLFQEGAKSFLHGPHQLNEQLAGLSLHNVRDSVFTETVAGPNGHPRHVVRDLYHERLGQIAAVTPEKIVFQRGRELVAIEALTGEELWSRQIGQPGQLLAADNRRVVCRPIGQRTVTTCRLVDGKPVGQFDLPERHDIFAVHGRMLIAVEESASRDSDRQPEDGEPREAGWRLTAYDPVLQKAIWSQPVSPHVLVQSADSDHLAVLDGKARKLRLIRVEDGEVLARHSISVTGRAQETEQKDQPEAEEPANNPPNAAEEPEEILAFWIDPSRDGYLVTTVDRVGGDDQVRVSALPSDRDLVYHPFVHGEVFQLDRRGDLLWQKRVENQVYDPSQPQASPVVMFLSRHATNRRRFITSTTQVALEILNRQTGEQLFQQVEFEPRSQLVTSVEPEAQQVTLSGTRNSYVITFGAEKSSGSPESEERPPQR